MNDDIQNQNTLRTLKNRADFVFMNKKAKKWVSKGIVLQASPIEASESGTIYTGFTVTKKTFKAAVKRNRVKRRLRALAQDILPSLAKDRHYYVFIGREDTLTRPYEALKSDLLWCLKRLDCKAERKNAP